MLSDIGCHRRFSECCRLLAHVIAKSCSLPHGSKSALADLGSTFQSPVPSVQALAARYFCVGRAWRAGAIRLLTACSQREADSERDWRWKDKQAGAALPRQAIPTDHRLAVCAVALCALPSRTRCAHNRQLLHGRMRNGPALCVGHFQRGGSTSQGARPRFHA